MLNFLSIRFYLKINYYYFILYFIFNLRINYCFGLCYKSDVKKQNVMTSGNALISWKGDVTNKNNQPDKKVL